MKQEIQFNLDALIYEILIWKQEFIKKQRKKNPDITNQELIKRIKHSKVYKFGERVEFVTTQLINDSPSPDSEKEVNRK